jgi:hypothetical protein
MSAAYTFTSQRREAIKRVEAATAKGIKEFGLSMSRKAKQKSPYLTGNNRRSITFEMPTPLRVRVYTESGYGGWLELGTSRMAPRPYFAPAYQETRDVMAKGSNWSE